MQKTDLTEYAKINTALIRVTCVFWLLAKLIGWRMWTAFRTFPTAPVFEYLDQVPSVIHLILLVLSALLIVLLFVFNKNKYYLFALLITEILSCLLDQNRWQPWEYQYIFIIFIFVINSNRQKLITVAFIMILVSTYFYSGFGKINAGFLQGIWTRMILEQFLKVPEHIAFLRLVHYSGYIPGLMELIAGMGLLFLRTQKVAAWMLIFMHLFVLVFIGPLGLNYNPIVWPWNVAMILYLYVIFLRKDQVSISLKSIFSGWNKLVFVCWGILPALNFVGCWDNYLSSNLYSGNLPRMLICIKDTSKCKQLQRFYRKDKHNICGGGAIIDVQNWAMAETNIAPYPEMRVYKKMERKLESQYPGAGLTCIFLVNGRRQ